MTARSTPLDGRNPLHVLAVWGMLRLIPGLRARWNQATSRAELDRDPTELLEALAPLKQCAPEGLPPAKRGKKALLTLDEYERAGTLSSLWTETMWSPWGKMVNQPVLMSDLIWTGGRQNSWWDDVRSIAGQLDGNGTPSRWVIRHRVWADVVGDLSVKRGVPGWGWDPAQTSRGATTSREPLSIKPLGNPALYWLAAMGLPTVPMLQGRTVGVIDNAWTWTWTLHEQMLGWDGVVALQRGSPRMPAEEIAARGAQRWQSRIESIGKYKRRLPATRLT